MFSGVNYYGQWWYIWWSVSADKRRKSVGLSNTLVLESVDRKAFSELLRQSLEILDNE